MADLLRLVFVIDLLGLWMYGSDLLYKLLCQYILRCIPAGGAAVVLTTLVYGSTYCLVLGMLWALWGYAPAS